MSEDDRPDAEAAQAVEQAILSRRSIRAFAPTPVDPHLVAHLLEVAARAPSGTNMQPWRVHVLTGAARERLVAALLRAHDAAAAGARHVAERRYYPQTFFEPYLSRRRKVGWDLYGLFGIGKGDAPRMHV